jgi:hypothetical protein
MVKSAVEYLENLIVFVRLSEAVSDLYILERCIKQLQLGCSIAQ